MELKEEVAEVFFGAADLCERGWCQGTWSAVENGKYSKWCAVGAIRSTQPYVSLAAKGLLMKNWLKLELHTLPNYNDQKNMTQSEIVRKLRQFGTEILNGEIEL